MLWNILIKTMEMYFVSCKKNTANKNSSVRKTKQIRLVLLLNSRKTQGSLKIKNSSIISVIFEMINLNESNC